MYAEGEEWQYWTRVRSSGGKGLTVRPLPLYLSVLSLTAPLAPPLTSPPCVQAVGKAKAADSLTKDYKKLREENTRLK